MDKTLFLLLFFLMPDRITIWHILFYAIIIGFVLALIALRKTPSESNWVWMSLFSLEMISLICSNIASTWSISWQSFQQFDMLTARVGVGFYAVITVVSAFIYVYSYRKIHPK